MHELSIAMSIVDVAQEAAKSRGAQVDAVYLDLGALSGVVKEALEFSYQIACGGTLLEGSRLIVREIPVEVYCPACQAAKVLPSMQLFCCPDCGAPAGELLHGKELAVTALELRE
jgi:hydrogenase nickel incorporation protein HypA/HybF